jgi:recombinational DNA repair protein (RecF pathway)
MDLRSFPDFRLNTLIQSDFKQKETKRTKELAHYFFESFLHIFRLSSRERVGISRSSSNSNLDETLMHK